MTVASTTRATTATASLATLLAEGIAANFLLTVALAASRTVTESCQLLTHIQFPEP